eukprot:g55113.t1
MVISISIKRVIYYPIFRASAAVCWQQGAMAATTNTMTLTCPECNFSYTCPLEDFVGGYYKTICPNCGTKWKMPVMIVDRSGFLPSNGKISKRQDFRYHNPENNSNATNNIFVKLEGRILVELNSGE